MTEPKSIPALTVRQPWAELILSGRKSIELRTWSTSHRGPIWLHAGLKVDTDAESRFGIDHLFTGGFVGSVTIAAVVRLNEDRWNAWRTDHLSGPFAPGFYGWLLSDPERFHEPIAGRGGRKLFVPDDNLQQALELALVPPPVAAARLETTKTMTDDMIDEPTFDGETDWRFPLRIGLLPTRGAQEFGDQLFETLGPPLDVIVQRLDLAVDGVDCDFVLVRTLSELDALTSSVTLSANLVILLEDAAGLASPEQAINATQALGASGYARVSGPSNSRLWSFLYELSHQATIEDALGVDGDLFELTGDSGALAVPPLFSFLERVASLDDADQDLDAVEAAAVAEPEPELMRGNESLPAVIGGFEIEVTQEMGRGQAAGELGLVVGDTFDAAEMARTLTADDARRYFHHETDGGSIAAGIGRDEMISADLDVRRTARENRSRFLQAALHRQLADGTAGAQVAYGFLRGEPMLILVGIGPAGPTRLVSNVALDETQLGQPGPKGWDLLVTLKPEVGEIQRRELNLPRSGSSTDVSFPINVTSGADHWRGRITVWHRNRAVQTGILSGPAINTDEDPGTGQRLSLVIDGEIRPMIGLDEQTRGGAAIELDENPAFYSSEGEWLIEPLEDKMLKASNRISKRLGERAVDLDEAMDLNDPRALALLEYLAVQGSLLLEALLPNEQQRASIVDEPFLQALRLSDAAPELPYEFVYDLPSPPPDPELCTEWMAGVEARKCPRCHADGADNGNVLCPLGFWGLRKVIERHNAVESTETRAQARLRRGDVAGRQPVTLRRAAFALADKADKVPRGAPADYVVPSSRIQEALEAAALAVDGPITTWDVWKQTIEKEQPDLLVILAHAAFDGDRDEWKMQIGTGSDLHVSRVVQNDVDVPPEVPGPVVFLFGCLTASEGAEQATFASKFRQRNASIVIGTTSAVLGRQAGPVAAELVAAIKKARGTEPLGELLRRARAAGLANGSVMAMALNAFGDADYQLTM